MVLNAAHITILLLFINIVVTEFRVSFVMCKGHMAPERRQEILVISVKDNLHSGKVVDEKHDNVTQAVVPLLSAINICTGVAEVFSEFAAICKAPPGL